MLVRRRLALGLIVLLLPIALFLVATAVSSNGDHAGDASRRTSCC
jgi:hypothetical protein